MRAMPTENSLPAWIVIKRILIVVCNGSVG